MTPSFLHYLIPGRVNVKRLALAGQIGASTKLLLRITRPDHPSGGSRPERRQADWNYGSAWCSPGDKEGAEILVRPSDHAARQPVALVIVAGGSYVSRRRTMSWIRLDSIV